MDSNSNIIEALNSISLEDEEEGGLEITTETLEGGNTQLQGFDAKLCVVGRFITEGRVEFEAMQHTLALLWKPGRGVYMKELESNLYLFQFYHELDVKRVMEGCPWSFTRRDLVMSRMKEGQTPRSVDLNFMDLWIQVYDLKPGFMSETVLKSVGNYIRSFVQSCPNNFTGVWREYMRIRVTINLSSPLKRRMKLKMQGNEWFWINFKYENVPSFCFICGIIGHTEKFCGLLFEKDENEIAKPYGAWMRAPLRKQIKPVGAKWLWHGGAGGSSQFQGEPNGEEDGKRWPVIIPTNQDAVIPTNQGAVRHNENQGVMASQINVQGGKGSQIISPTITNTITEQLNKKDIGVIETKKRRTEGGLGSDKTDQNIEVLMASDDIHDTDMHTGGPSNTLDSKNVYGASIQGGTRLALWVL